MFLPIDQSEIEKGKKMESGIHVTMHRKNISTHPWQDILTNTGVYKSILFFKAKVNVRRDKEELKCGWKLRQPWPDSIGQIYLVDL